MKTTLQLDAYIVDALLPDLVGHDGSASGFLTYLVLWRRTRATRTGTAASLRTLAEETGLSKRAVQSALINLVRRKLVSATRSSPTAVPLYRVHRPWVRPRRNAATT